MINIPKAPAGYIQLVLPERDSRSLEQPYLEIPTRIIKRNCRNPLKYILYLGWAILGIVGILRISDGTRVDVDVDEDVVDRECYYYELEDGDNGELLFGPRPT